MSTIQGNKLKEFDAELTLHDNDKCVICIMYLNDTLHDQALLLSFEIHKLSVFSFLNH